MARCQDVSGHTHTEPTLLTPHVRMPHTGGMKTDSTHRGILHCDLGPEMVGRLDLQLDQLRQEQPHIPWTRVTLIRIACEQYLAREATCNGADGGVR